MARYISQGAGPALVASCIVPLFFTWIFFCLRVFVRWGMLHIWKLEDWLFVASQISFTALAISALLSAIHGNGQHEGNLNLADAPLALKFFFMGEIFYNLTTIFIRLSIGFCLLRICPLKVHQYIIKITMVIISLLSAIYFVFTIMQCNPVRYFWLGGFTSLKGSCFPKTVVQNVTISYSAFAAATDLIFGILPIFVIWNLKMNRKAKTVAGCLLGLGILAGFTVIIRTEYVRLVNLTTDFLFSVSSVSIWSLIEPAIGIICTAASTLRPLFSSLKEKSSNRSRSYSTGGTRSRVHGESENFRLSRSMRSGSKSKYLKSVDLNDGADSFEMDNMERRVEGGRAEPSGQATKHSKDEKGIMYSTTVDIRSESHSDMV